MVESDYEQVYDHIMFRAVGEQNEHHEHPLSVEEFAAAWAAHERTGAQLAMAVGHFDTTGEYGTDGAASMLAWLRSHCRMSDTDASVLVRRGRFLRDHELVAAAALDSTLSAGQVHALRTNVTRATESVFADHQTELVAIIAPLDVRATEQVCRSWRLHAEAITDQPEPCAPQRELTYTRASDGSLVGRFVFDEALSSEFDTALGTALTWEGNDDQRSVAVRRADALFDIVAHFNANHSKDGTPRNRPHVEITIDGGQLRSRHCHATTIEGDPVPASTTDAFLCDSTIQRFILNGSVPIDVGRATRTVPIDIFRAVAKRDGGCRHPGCDRKVAWCEAHHIRFWRHGGTTSLDNLVLLCTRHHHLIHRPGWQVELLPDAIVELTTPDGRTIASEPRPTPKLPRIRGHT